MAGSDRVTWPSLPWFRLSAVARVAPLVASGATAACSFSQLGQRLGGSAALAATAAAAITGALAGATAGLAATTGFTGAGADGDNGLRGRLGDRSAARRARRRAGAETARGA